jgi:protease inhibitor
MNFKKIITLGAAFAMTLGMNVFADSNKIIVNGKNVEGSAYTENEINYLPLRSIAEALGFEVEWNGEFKSISLSNMPQYVTMTINVDGYTIAKTAPMPLGAAPVIKDNVTYVPTELFTDLLDYNVENDGESIIITDNTAAEHSTVVKEIDENGILIEDSEMGEVRLVVEEDTPVTDDEGNSINIADIAVGDILTVEYGDAMTMSIPPMNNPKSIVINKVQN